MLNWININFNEVQYLVLLFIVYMAHQRFNMPYYIKRLLRLKLTKHYKLIDCFPCVTFWTTLIITFNPLVSVATFLTAVIIDRK